MFFTKKTGFHCLVLYVQSEEPHPIHVVLPQEFAGDVISTMKKFEKSSLNNHRYIGNLGPFVIIQDIQGFQKIEIHNETLSWSEPILYTDFAKKINERLQNLIDDETNEVEEELVYFIGEFTMMEDNGFIAPF
ncbi:hypothetical protein [Caldalkalibacillus mannanilyticus]|uniref:hypothetical protein n=1 Tax=Caldalkalibacillus mannanilyticus TaxID=1418 RepID=UPI00046912D8|nr:hypothetical protein [Caldalkalibacillus mannanilyticus]